MSDEASDIETSVTRSPETVCSEDEFGEILAPEVRPLLHIADLVESNARARLSRRLLATVSELSADLEDLLIEYDAPYNAIYSQLFEYVSALEIFAAAGYTTKGLELRTARYGLGGDQGLDSEFADETRATQDFIETGLRALLMALSHEVRLHCGHEVEGDAPEDIMQERLVQKKLPHTVGTEDVENLRERIASEASLYITALKTLRQRSTGERIEKVDDMRRFVLDVCDEEQARFFEAKLANIQSRYDTFVMNTTTEKNDPSLRRFRYTVGTSRELFRLLGLLVHFYERHEDDLRSKEAKDRVAELVDKRLILDRILNYALYFGQKGLTEGEDRAKELLERYTENRSVVVAVPEGVMIHARPASLIVKIVAHYGTPVEMEMNGERCYAGSITQVIMMSGANLDCREVRFVGDEKPVADLETLFTHRLGEDGIAALPNELSYLR